jgi:23S rRNA (adenine2503-C2)-methyltransferase
MASNELQEGVRQNLLGMLPPDLVAWLAQCGVSLSDGEARRVLAARLAHGVPLDKLRGLRKAVRLAVEQHTCEDRPHVVDRVVDPDDSSVRYLFEAPDGARFEAVHIPLEKPGRYTVCLSSQVGCAMACVFCATGRLGLQRNLTAAEIVGSFLVVKAEATGHCGGAVFMGQGEPLHNYEQVIQAARVLSDPCGAQVDGKTITISTVGLVPQIRRYTAEGHPWRLIVSLTSARAGLRQQLLPVAGRQSLQDLADALRERAAAVPGRQTIAWVLLGGVNTGAEEATALRELLGDLPLRVNLIDVNDRREGGFRRATDAERHAFFDALQVLGAPIVRRYSVGSTQSSACGMLAAEPHRADQR